MLYLHYHIITFRLLIFYAFYMFKVISQTFAFSYLDFFCIVINSTIYAFEQLHYVISTESKRGHSCVGSHYKRVLLQKYSSITQVSSQLFFLPYLHGYHIRCEL